MAMRGYGRGSRQMNQELGRVLRSGQQPTIGASGAPSPEQLMFAKYPGMTGVSRGGGAGPMKPPGFSPPQGLGPIMADRPGSGPMIKPQMGGGGFGPVMSDTGPQMPPPEFMQAAMESMGQMGRPMMPGPKPGMPMAPPGTGAMPGRPTGPMQLPPQPMETIPPWMRMR